MGTDEFVPVPVDVVRDAIIQGPCPHAHAVANGRKADLMPLMCTWCGLASALAATPQDPTDDRHDEQEG